MQFWSFKHKLPGMKVNFGFGSMGIVKYTVYKYIV